MGDPSGRNTERPLSDEAVVRGNVEHLVSGITRFFTGAIKYASKRMPIAEGEMTPPAVENNLKWFQDVGLLEFLRKVGTNARVNTMMARERHGIA